jgi:hypothetical protein
LGVASRDDDRVAKSRMFDVVFLDKAAHWADLAYIVTVGLTVMMSVAVMYISHQRSALKDAEAKRLEAESAERVAKATQQYTEANERAASAEAVASQLRKNNLDLSNELEQEKRLRVAAEEKLAQQVSQPNPVAAANSAARTLTSDQTEMLAKTMGGFAGKRAALIELADPEAAALARQLTPALEKAQWTISVSRVGGLVPPQQGIICAHSPNDAAAAALVSMLRSLDLIVYERNENIDQMQIIVGLKPRN